MANVVRFTLPTARDLYVRGAGFFNDGVLDVDVNDLDAVSRARYLTKPYGAIEVGIVDSATPKPTLPAVPGPPNPDPYPQYVTDADLADPASGPSAALRAAFGGSGDPSANLVRWAPPAQTSPTIYAHAGTFLSVTAAANEDVIINGVTSGAAIGGISVTGGRHVRIIGGKIAKTVTGASIRVVGATGSVFIEGVEIDASGYNGDAINACGVQSGSLTYPDVYIQNCRITGLNGTAATNHADLYQPQGPVGRVFIDKLTGSSDYQGIFVNQFPVTEMHLSRVNLTKIPNPSQPVTYLLWLADVADIPYPTTMDEVYVSLPAGQTLANAGVAPYAGQTSTAPGVSGQAIGVLTDSKGNAYFPSAMQTAGKVYPGAPANGDFVPAGTVGIGYRPKGYASSAPAIIDTALPMPPSGTYFFPIQPATTNTANTLGNGSLRLLPFVVTQQVGVARLGAEITSAGDAGCKLRLGIYADSGKAWPGALVVDAGTIAGDVVAVQELTLASPVILQPGVYWIGGAVQGVVTTQPTVRTPASSVALAVPISFGTTMPAAGAQTMGALQGGVSGALPATFSTTVTNAGTAPRLFVRLG